MSFSPPASRKEGFLTPVTSLSAPTGQIWWATPQDQVRSLHSAGSGHAILLQRLKGDRQSWDKGTPPELPGIVETYLGRSNVYITFNRFVRWRRSDLLLLLQALYIDIDFYDMTELKDRSPEQIAQLILLALESYWDPELRRYRTLPEPSVIVYGGHGMQVLWLFSPVAAKAKPRWDACQKVLYDTLKGLGADGGALDTCRMVRLVGSRHSETGDTVREVWSSRHIWDFDSLADEILPFTREQLREMRVKREADKRAKAARANRKADKVSSGRTEPRKPKPPKNGFTVVTLHQGRLTDYERLIQRRYEGKIPDGQRFLWLSLVAASMSWVSPTTLVADIEAFAAKFCDFTPNELRSAVSASINRAAWALMGKTITQNGRNVDPRYIRKTENIIKDLHITPEEQRELRVLISPAEKKRRKNEAEQQKRLATGETKQDRTHYEQESISRREPWTHWGWHRSTWYRHGCPEPPSMPEPPMLGQGA